ncbi:type II toxin-antitoxin system VapC family toxin [Rhizobium sp. 32-5/1]|uniref:type II toxin-antitoxin system VapC family toxin n=1 Tax=Rhizobium sp. 32-5/1 TaxID=3019602 RepID=UPI00240D9BA6|nr:type II toxin-antitoxin system VapC family toxin [Rhizobium sp. 32-5/1]WEZ82854.1 type II toxin-antitoxin system VapC family toxin [Rhizobium sp. 32-5/1]
MTIVIDASIALAWCFEDEASDETDAVAHRVIAEGGVVPSLFHLELANVLLPSERRGRISASEIAQRLDLIAQMPIETDPQTAGRAWNDTLSLARAHQLTSYDAAYLELAARKGAKLATKDKALATAANQLGVTLIMPQ